MIPSALVYDVTVKQINDVDAMDFRLTARRRAGGNNKKIPVKNQESFLCRYIHR
jgi:hypothetical protein